MLIVVAVVAGLALLALIGRLLLTRTTRVSPTGGRRGETLEPPRTTSPEAPRRSTGVSDTIDLDGDRETVEVPEDLSTLDLIPADQDAALVEPEVLVPPSFRDRLARARGVFSGAFSAIRGGNTIDQAAWDELEEALLMADVGLGPATELLDGVRSRVKELGVSDADGLIAAVKAEMKARLAVPNELHFGPDSPTVWLFVGVNGVGKTTSIGKVGNRLVGDGHKVVMAAGDTFRAAAAEQLETWADRAGAAFIRGAEGGDPSSVIFDGIAHAAANNADVVLCDTAGRLHTKSNLMDELSKVRRVADKGAGQVSEVLLVIDATTGQNGLVQARQFAEATDVTGVVLTKLDGSAKGGIVFAITSELGIPVKLVGLGESAVDLVDFDPDEFVDALLDG